jgi:WD40 repeat protein
MLTSAFSWLLHLVLVLTINDSYTQIALDPLNNLYCISGSNTIIKYDSNGMKRYSYTPNSVGALYDMDVSNPLKVLLFFKDAATIQICDNTLSPISTISLRSLGIMQPVAACLASDNTIWIFDVQDFKLKQIDLQQNIIRQSNDLLLETQLPLNISHLIQCGRYLFACDADNGIHVFDSYGTYVSTLPFSNLNHFDVIDNKVFYLKNKTIYDYDMQTLNQTFSQLPDSTTPSQVSVTATRLAELQSESVLLFR